ncbi:hypothetical protein D7Z96_01860 [Pseudarthrobacter phenanthrenivorans]|uniref:Lipoprotein n=2 Tax=Pseudarthrobacter phenanthrenivorans TaxID=361575 RepID=A0A3B0G1L2_PSEPS|nr:hypothetical protein [Pseudarthrobacter phenanthrenivorans]ADX72709.1 hypothetical protein Asphe3_15400 [Pseudarthrobacter phenanthrenivorans Sphe3]RKO27692.1 hypothetical protein D7Z96_01860 [Pseudarthrobacter phenanthrenivorans]TPV48409.1 hypothetical protein FJ661_18780 [Pseudarthrobacter phenanthrenivorans]
MTVFGNLKPARLAVLIAGAAVALAACSPSPSATQDPSASATATAGSRVTASPSPSASPNTSATVGAVVEGFPQQLLPLMPGATVVSSSFDKASSPATAALVATITAPPATVIDFYTKALEGQGFKAVPGESVGSVASKDFVRGDNETVNLSVVEAAGVATFTIGANVAAESAK